MSTNKDIWHIRNQALDAISNDLKAENDALLEVFALIDMAIDQFNSEIQKDDVQFAYVCGHTLIKAKRFALGCYSLVLDGLAQEAGALFRPLVETLEQLTYYSQDRNRVQKAIDGKLPPAGKIAQVVESELHDIRKFLNDHASHFSFKEDSIQPRYRPYNGVDLKTNILQLYTITLFVANEATKCLLIINKVDDDLVEAGRKCEREAMAILPISLPIPGSQPSDLPHVG